MLSIQEIEKYYPENVRVFKRNILREYLQYKILAILFDSEYASKISFLGGTALRIVHGNSRFSEDLDFDNFRLEKPEFENISALVKKELELEGYEVEIRNVFKGAYRCYVKIPKLLFESGLSGYSQEKILIQLDTAPHGFPYKPEKTFLNKFDIFTQISATPLDVILSQKIYAIFNRKTKKGRDFYDTVFLFAKTRPNYAYLKARIGIKNSKDLKKKLLCVCEKTNFKRLAQDVKPFLINPGDTRKVELFEEFIKGMGL